MGSELIGSRFETQERRKKSGGRSWCWAANRQEVGSRLKKEERRAEEGGGDRQRIDRKWVRDARKKRIKRTNRKEQRTIQNNRSEQRKEQRKTTNNSEQISSSKEQFEKNNKQVRNELLK